MSKWRKETFSGIYPGFRKVNGDWTAILLPVGGIWKIRIYDRSKFVIESDRKRLHQAKLAATAYIDYA